MLNGNLGSGMMNGTKVQRDTSERQPHFDILPESPQLPRRSPSLNRAGGADDLHGDESVEDGGGERTPFLPPVTLSPGQAPRKAQDQAAWHLLEGHQPPRASSQFRARIENTLAFMLRHGCGRQLLMLAIVFLTFWLVIFVFVLPVMDAKDLARLKVPNSLSEVQEVYQMLGDYKSKHYNVILLGFTCAYLAKQSLALPGSPLFNLLGGALVLILLALLVQQYQY